MIRLTTFKHWQKLYNAGEKKWGTDEAVFNSILAVQSYSQLRAVFDMYVKVANKDIEDSIKSEMSGDLKAGMIAIGQLLRHVGLTWILFMI